MKMAENGRKSAKPTLLKLYFRNYIKIHFKFFLSFSFLLLPLVVLLNALCVGTSHHQHFWTHKTLARAQCRIVNIVKWLYLELEMTFFAIVFFSLQHFYVLCSLQFCICTRCSIFILCAEFANNKISFYDCVNEWHFMDNSQLRLYPICVQWFLQLNWWFNSVWLELTGIARWRQGLNGRVESKQDYSGIARFVWLSVEYF